MPVRFSFSHPAMRSWLLIHQCRNLLKKAIDRELSLLGITARKQSVLLAIRACPKPVRVGDVAQWLDREPNVISTQIDVMEKEGLVTRTHDDHNDRRTVILEMTPKGRELFDKSDVRTKSVLKELFGDFTEDELEAVCSFLGRFRRKALKAVYPKRDIGEPQVLEEEV